MPPSNSVFIPTLIKGKAGIFQCYLLYLFPSMLYPLKVAKTIYVSVAQ